MQSFVVSARKYRPSSWHDVIGQDQVVVTLKNAIKNNHLAQSFLFCGPRGVGKTTCARILAKTINCENIQENGEACNTCESCSSFNENASFNIHEIDAASNNSVEDIRSLVDQVRYAPASGKFKIYIIDEVHMLSASAFNAFLKTLEEPPLYVKFILATTEKHKIIPTILSRCQIFDFNRIRIKDMTQQLEIICKNEGIDCTDEAMHLIAQKADGAMRDALSIFDRITSFSGKSITAKDVIENLNILDYEYFFKITDAFVVEDVATALVIFDEVVNKGFDGDIFINGLAEHFRNILVCKDEATLKLLDTSETVIERYKTQSNLISASFLLSGLNILNSTDVNYRASKNKRLHVELALMKLCYVHSAVSTLSSGSMEKKTPDLNEKRPNAAIKPIASAVKTTETNNISDISTVIEEPVKKVRVENSTIITPQLESVETVVIPKKTDIRQAIKKEEDEKSAALLTKTVEEPLKVISPEMFFIVWKQYADFIRKDQNRVAIIMDAAAVSINETNNIVVRLESNLEANIMKEMQNDLREFIKDGLENNQFDISFIVESVKSDKIKRPYTTQEKYKKMEEINPLIKELKETLGFELDY
ncbi:MAG TPA: DNA polymerase III subunit gamma/tau [Chitinophagales bacterium]|nr:DNA polymerase III subunit gamma/tau [Chitinophagales bacterium]HRG85168.1 DNA polymerase III subunit gamma/tau [Chitinophagales bacterium]HRH53570.1 DNA polymerase III subunit gamma/tau [Chitinophagales bacterium]